MQTIEFWKFTAGLGLFLYAIRLTEEALKQLSGRQFKKLLRRHTRHPLQAIAVGTFSTAILQSSSAVTLMLLAFVGSGVITFSSAVGIIIGSNLGTTFTGWIVSTLGFEFDIDQSILPLIAIGTLLYVFLNSKKVIADWGKLILGLGILFFGLNLMKESVGTFQAAFDPARIANYGPYFFALVGFLFTGVIQSSSATMVIALTALNSNLITLSGAAGLVIGADLGTTITVILGAMAGSPEKRRVAAAHFLFNLVTDVIALLALPLLLAFATMVVGTDNHLYALVFFHSSFNLVGIFLFLPIIRHFSQFLERRFGDDKNMKLVLEIAPHHSEAGLEALKSEIKKLIRRTMVLNRSILRFESDSFTFEGFIGKLTADRYSTQYGELKIDEAKLIDYTAEMQRESLTVSQSETLSSLISGIKETALSAKGIKDVKHNLDEFGSSANDDVHAIYRSMLENFHSLYNQIEELLRPSQAPLLFEGLTSTLKAMQKDDHQFADQMKVLLGEKKIPNKHILSLFNTNRELHYSNRSLVLAIGDVLLPPQQSADLSQIS